MLLPFTNAVVPTVDLADKRVVIELPQEIEGDNPAEAGTSPRVVPAKAGPHNHRAWLLDWLGPEPLTTWKLWP